MSLHLNNLKRILNIVLEDNMEILNNGILIGKLDSISTDLKYYINIQASLAESLLNDGVERNSSVFLEKEEIEELLNVRKSVKCLLKKLKDRLYNKPKSISSIRIYDDTGSGPSYIINQIDYENADIIVGSLNTDNERYNILINKKTKEVLSVDFRFYYAEI